MVMKTRIPGDKAHKTSQISKRIHEACMRNLALYLQGHISFEDWQAQQKELESRLTPEPELPFSRATPKPIGRMIYPSPGHKGPGKRAVSP